MSMLVDEEFWRLATVVRVSGLSKTVIQSRMKRSAFPKSYLYKGSNRRFWRASDIRRWMAEELG